MKSYLRWLCLLAACCLSSCGPAKPERLPVYPTQAKITMQGKPIEKVMLVLHPLNGLDLQGAAKPNAKTDKDGVCKLSTYDAQDGAPAGKYAVLLYWFRNDPDEDGSMDRFQGRYANPNKPVAIIDIQAGQNTLPPIDLK